VLAQAELQHAKEAKRAGEWRYKYFIMRHGFALGLAMVIAIAGVSGTFYMVHDRQTAIPPSTVKQLDHVVQQTQFQAAPGTATVTKQSLIPEEEPHPVATVVTEAPATVQTQPVSMKATDRQGVKRQHEQEAAVPIVELPPDEMQKIMRAAGKSLRGQ
jgi:hypothetical protein